MDPMTSLAAVIAALPMLYVVQASIDAHMDGTTRSKRRAAEQIVRGIEREMRSARIVADLARSRRLPIRIQARG